MTSLLFAAACGSGDSADGPSAASGAAGTGAGTGASGTGTAGTGAAGTGGSTQSGGTGGAGTSGTGGGTAGASGGGTGGVDGGAAGGSTYDPAQPGPFAVGLVSGSVAVSSTGTNFETTCFLPETETGPFPLVVFSHGFQLPPSQYFVSAGYLATFGFVVCVHDYPAGMFSPNHATNAREIIGVVDWALGASPVTAKVDSARIGLTGHSLGGKISVIAASLDGRIGAVLGLDPVDAATACNPTDCPDASSLLPLPIPTGFLGETTDASGGFQPCAPEADNFATFFASAASPSIKVHVDGANHMSFLDDPGSCGLQCSFCQPATRDHAEVIGLTRAYLAAFFLRHLAGNTAYDDYLFGAAAQQRYVQTGVAQVQTK